MIKLIKHSGKDKFMSKINVRGVLFDNVTMDQALRKSIDFINSNNLSTIYTPNAEIVQSCIENNDIMEIINSADMVIPDGAGVVLASRILKTPLKSKVAGCELAEKIAEYCSKNNKKIFLLGSNPETIDKNGVKILSTADKAAEKLKMKYNGLIICGTADGYFDPKDNDEIIEKINNSSADVVFVCLGAPRQEKWIHAFKSRINAKLMIGLGGSLDVFAGEVKRAPDIFIKLNLEWLYRLIKQPQRLGRMMSIPKFLLQTCFYSNKEKAVK